MKRERSPDDPRIAWAMIEELQADNANHDPDDVMAEVTAAVEEVRAEGQLARQRRSGHKPAPTLADGYQSIPALQPPKSKREIAAIVADERAERERERIERDAKAEHAARALSKSRSHGR
ncbi:MAG: hypothetical protein M3Y58_18080 [Chloroflexota bacterium]|nr:hypothetical protein [Chloroflexota bacterium]